MTTDGVRVCLAVSALVGLAEVDTTKDALCFHVETGTRITRSVRIESDMILASESMTIDGQDVEALRSDVGLGIHREDSYTVRDIFEVVADGQPRRLRRSFENLSSKGAMDFPEDPGNPEEETYESKLEGSDVVFSWDEDKEMFDAAFPPGEAGEEHLLRGLDEDMDLRALLPAGEVSVGDEWRIELGKDLLSPGGDLRIWDHEEEPDEIAADDQLRENRRTKISATYNGIVVEAGVRLASIHLQVESASSSELSQSSGSMRVEDSFNLDGELRWDAARGHLRALSLQGKTRLNVREGSEVDQQSLEVVSEFTGEVHLEMDLEDD